MWVKHRCPILATCMLASSTHPTPVTLQYSIFRGAARIEVRGNREKQSSLIHVSCHLALAPYPCTHLLWASQPCGLLPKAGRQGSLRSTLHLPIPLGAGADLCTFMCLPSQARRVRLDISDTTNGKGRGRGKNFCSHFCIPKQQKKSSSPSAFSLPIMSDLCLILSNLSTGHTTSLSYIQTSGGSSKVIINSH